MGNNMMYCAKCQRRDKWNGVSIKRCNGNCASAFVSLWKEKLLDAIATYYDDIILVLQYFNVVHVTQQSFFHNLHTTTEDESGVVIAIVI